MIEILKAIYTLLQGNGALANIVGDKIFPNVVPDTNNTGIEVDYPLIVMKRLSLDAEYSKTCVKDSVTVDITAYGQSYSQGIDIIKLVRDTVDRFKGTVEGINITDIRILGMSEDYVDGAYYQSITISVE